MFSSELLIMNITPQVPHLSIPTVLNPHTESLRRENLQREIITKPAPTNQSTAEKGVASDKERGRTPAQNSENIDFSSLRDKAEQANSSISEQTNDNEQTPDDSSHSNYQQDTNQQDSSENSNELEAFAQEQKIKELKSRDREVRSHELAHASVGGATTGAPSYSFEQGPDGKKYAVEGEVSVDLSSVKGDPRATITKMQKVHAAALAPANPSVQDTRVAASAAQIILQAQSELLAAQGNEFAQDKTDKSGYLNPNDTLTSDSIKQGSNKQNSQGRDFDALINQTLEAQEFIASANEKLTQSNEVQQRAGRIESFYSNITTAYEKPVSYQFELTA